MFDQHRIFLDWASQYDTGDATMRSKAMHDHWERQLTCKRISVNGGKPVDEILKAIFF